jgi:hypothetical protein
MEKSSLIATVAAIIIISIAVLCAVRLNGVLLVWSTVSLAPMFISLACAFLFPKSSCQLTLAVGSILYTVWMVFVVVYGFLIYPGPFSPLVLFVGPIVSLPIMFIIWIVAAIQNASVPKNVLPQTQDN